MRNLILLDSVMTLPTDRFGWRLPLLESTDGAPTLPRDLRKMTERSRQSLQGYLQSLPLQDLKRRLDKVHSMQSEAHQHARYYGTNTSHQLALANLTIMDEALSKAIEYVEDDALAAEAEEPAMTRKYDVREPAWMSNNWALPAPDPAVLPSTHRPAISRKALESKYGVSSGNAGYQDWRTADAEGDE